MALHFVLASDLRAIENVLKIVEEAAELSGLGRVELWCGPVAAGIGIGAAVAAAGAADVEAIFTWFTGGASMGLMNDEFCGEFDD